MNKGGNKKGKHQTKRRVATPHKTLKTGISKTQFERGCNVAHKMFRLLGLDPAIFDGFTKKQKLFLLNNETQPPIICAEAGSSVPRQYLNKIRKETYAYLNGEYVDQETKFSYMEMLTYGISIWLMLEIGGERNMFADTCSRNKVFSDFLNERGESKNVLHSKWFGRLYAFLEFQMTLYSQMNFRTYGYNISHDITEPQIKNGFGTIRLEIKINSIESESIYFTHNGVSRKAFKVMNGANSLGKATHAFIMQSKLFPESKERDKPYFLYIQSHVIQRFKERMNILETTGRNHLLNISITLMQDIVRNNEGQLLLVCSANNNTMGYFPFVIKGNKLLILSFLPFVSASCPEGAKLHKLLGLQKEDIKYLGMDKMSFYVMVDFDQIPVLRDALKETGIWKTKKMFVEDDPDPPSFNEEKTSFVKSFFQKLALRNAAQFPDETEADL
ncbi:MAG: hypothetical protein LBC98_05695 [Prevotellaceae bacterium]|jgi:hypothetical protein|nr:hypothetical protein [Prevotellaceae bacterium]